VLLLYVAFLARSQQYGAVKNSLKGLQRLLHARGWSSHLSQFWRVQQALAGALGGWARGCLGSSPLPPSSCSRSLAILRLGSGHACDGVYLHVDCICCISEEG
jgi:hypothetical protein